MSRSSGVGELPLLFFLVVIVVCCCSSWATAFFTPQPLTLNIISPGRSKSGVVGETSFQHHGIRSTGSSNGSSSSSSSSNNDINKTSETMTAATRQEDLTFRAPKISDVESISNLLVECFETELQWFEWPERETRRKRYRDMLQKSFLRRLDQSSDNNNCNDANNNDDDVSFMLLVESKSNMVGFVQLGLLPPPPGYSVAFDDDNTQEEGTVMWHGIPVTPVSSSKQPPKDVPYMANLCVLPSFRKTGIGTKLVNVCLFWLQKNRHQYSHIFLAVDSNNRGAQEFYQTMGFTKINVGGNDNPSDHKRQYYVRPLLSTIGKDPKN